MIYFWLTIEFAFCFIDTILFYNYCSKVFTKHDNYSILYYFIILLLITILTFAVTLINVYSIYKNIFSIVILMMFILMSFNDNLKKKLLFFILFVAIMISSEVLATVLISMSKIPMIWNVVLEQSKDRIIMFIISRILILLFTKIVVHFRLKDDLILPLRNWLVFFSSFAITLILSFLLMHIGLTINNSYSSNIMFLALILSFIIISFSNYYLFYQMNKYFKTISENNMIEFQNELIEKYIIQKEESDKMTRILSHDLKHNLQLWKQLSNSNEFSYIINSINEYEIELEKNKIIDVGNELANVIINNKIVYARRNNIEFDISGGFNKGIMVSEVDLCSLLNNLIDNAMEATAKIKNEQKRKISIYIKRDGKFQFIEIENSYEIEPVVRGNTFITNKKNRVIHGIGMMSIDKVVEKYQGAVERKYKNHIFTSIIMLRAYDSKE